MSVPAGLLGAFAVFSFNSPTGSRTSSGYMSQVRHVIAPSGLDMWAIPTTDGLCVWAVDRGTGLFGRPLNGGGGGCSANIRQAESEGSGFSSTGSNGSIIYGIVPKTTHSVTIQTGAHTHRIIHPVDGVYIATTPFKFG